MPNASGALHADAARRQQHDGAAYQAAYEAACKANDALADEPGGHPPNARRGEASRAARTTGRLPNHARHDPSP